MASSLVVDDPSNSKISARQMELEVTRPAHAHDVSPQDFIEIL